MRLAIPATVIDLAAMSLDPERFTYAVSLDKTKYGGAISKKSSPLCMLAGVDYLDHQPRVIAQMKVVIKAGFDVNAREFSGNEEMAASVKSEAKRIDWNFTPSTPLEKACRVLFLESVELLVSEGAKLGRALEVLAYFTGADEDEEAQVAEIKEVLKKAKA